MNPKIILYGNAILLFFFTFLLASQLIIGIKSGNFDWFKIVLFFTALLFSLFTILKYAKIINKDKS